jgi:hypothetical protein
MEGRLRDDRGNRRDHERNDRINDGDRPDSPSRERQSKALEMGNHDETMYDAYAGPGVPPFSSDMPPPVLMPVPGAGSVASSNHPSFHNLTHIFYLFRFGEWLYNL